MVVSGLRAACPSHLTLWRLSSWEMGICPVPSSSSAVEGPPVPRYRPIMRHPYRCLVNMDTMVNYGMWCMVHGKRYTVVHTTWYTEHGTQVHGTR